MKGRLKVYFGECPVLRSSGFKDANQYSYFTDKARKKDPNYDNLSRVEKSLLLAGYDKNKVEMKEVNISLSGITVEKQSIDEYVEKRKQQKQLQESKEQPLGTKDC